MMPEPIDIGLRDAAIEYAERYGWSVFPVRPRGKEPATAHGFKDATKNLDWINRWWADGKSYNIGIATGCESGVFVVDVDGLDGEASLSELVKRYGDLPPTVEARTGKGRHLYFRYPDGADIRNSAGKLGKGIDVRGDGGYVLAPPSVHPLGAIYRWVDGRVPWEITVAECPDWLLIMLTSGRLAENRKTSVILAKTDACGKAELERMCAELAVCSEGRRNNLLNKVAYRSGQLVGAGHLTERDTRARLLEAAGQCGLGKKESERTFDSGFNIGIRSPADDGITAEFTDLYSAEALVRRHGADMRYCSQLGGWQLWDGCRWVRDERDGAACKMKDVARVEFKESIKQNRVLSERLSDADGGESADRAEIKIELLKVRARFKWWRGAQNQSRVKSALDSARSESGIATTAGEYDTDPMLFNVLNGTIDLGTGELRPHNRADMITKLAPVVFDPSARAPWWDAFLRRIFEDKTELISSVQRLFGYGITGEVSEERLVILWGSGANGKSTLIRAIASVTGDYQRQIDPDALLDSKYSSAKIDSEKARLKGTHIAICSETSEGRSLSDGLLKQVASRDRVVGRFLYHDSIEFDPSHKIYYVSNHRPRVRTTDLGTWRRLLLVPFNVTISEAERDSELDDKLRAEASGILNWLVAGCLAWQRIGLAPCDEIMQATKQYKSEEDVLEGFLSERCELGPNFRISSSIIYGTYAQWCLEKGEKPLNQTAFGRRLREKGFSGAKSNGHIVYRGIQLSVAVNPRALLP